MMAMIHDNTELPLIEVGGFRLHTGQRHNLAFRRKNFQLLSSPYSNCTNTVPLAMQAMFNQYSGADYSYSQELCYVICFQSYV